MDLQRKRLYEAAYKRAKTNGAPYYGPMDSQIAKHLSESVELRKTVDQIGANGNKFIQDLAALSERMNEVERTAQTAIAKVNGLIEALSKAGIIKADTLDETTKELQYKEQGLVLKPEPVIEIRDTACFKMRVLFGEEVVEAVPNIFTQKVEDDEFGRRLLGHSPGDVIEWDRVPAPGSRYEKYAGQMLTWEVTIESVRIDFAG